MELIFRTCVRDLAVNSKQRILQSAELNDSERRAILGGNASRLFRADSVLGEM
jgi:predicted TIM-barrel fold metal-dependent hydrolase